MLLDTLKVIVTGGGRGIGKAIALALAREGADVCVTARSEFEIDLVAHEIRDMGRLALALQANARDSSGSDYVVKKTLEVFGHIDLLVNNAGGSVENAPIAESDPDSWIETIETNLIGTYLYSRAVLPGMIERHSGKIINIGSGMGHLAHGIIGNSAYSASKAGVWMFTQCLAMEVWEHGIDVNEIVPGPVETRMTERKWRAGKPTEFSPSERTKSPEDVAPVAVWLAAQPVGGSTGQYFSLARRPL